MATPEERWKQAQALDQACANILRKENTGELNPEEASTAMLSLLKSVPTEVMEMSSRAKSAFHNRLR